MKNKKILFRTALILILILLFLGWKFFGSALSTSQGDFFYVKTGSDLTALKKELLDKKILSSSTWFDWASRLIGYKNIKPGRYKINHGMSLFTFVRMLKNGNQVPVNFVITKLRTPEDLAKKTEALFECDSLQMYRFIKNEDSMKTFGLDTNTAMAAVMPYTYSIRWNTTPRKIFQNFMIAFKNFWTDERKQKADSIHLTPVQVSTLASIIEEETNKKTDKPLIASVYLNRISIGMPLQADPTIKYAMKDFKLKRIYHAYLNVVSPYNTYTNKGLPPGPICTPSVETIEAVLNAPKTGFLYFVASSNFDGSSVFSSTLAEHLKNAKLYQQALDKLDSSNKK
ncbi:MAG: endolytic transglycosylase MltG [Bacteroidetes bacterium]|nr:endolytic transglycosylase MltG [Bacteroidota bacterium]MBS1931920.1 endolytic transglycosylase MltG [Bacteroidota bacterium]